MAEIVFLSLYRGGRDLSLS